MVKEVFILEIKIYKTIVYNTLKMLKSSLIACMCNLEQNAQLRRNYRETTALTFARSLFLDYMIYFSNVTRIN